MKREILNGAGGDKATAQSVLDYLLGDINGNNSDYLVYKYRETTLTVGNRLNMLWIYSLFLITVPLQWLIKGSVGLKEIVRLGRLCLS